MSDESTNPWEVVKGTGWIPLPGFGRINPRRDNVDGGREYFTAQTDDDEYAVAVGGCISGGPETYYFELDESFMVSDGDHALELNISLLPRGVYAVRYRPGVWPSPETGGGWSTDS